MLDRILDTNFARQRRRWVYYFAVFAALMTVVAWRISIRDIWFCIALAALITFVVSVRLLDDFFHDVYRCPKCRKVLYSRDMIAKPHFATGDPMVYACDHCNIEWDTGQKASSD